MMSRTRRTAAIALAVAALAVIGGCNRRGDKGPVIVSAIGARPTLTDPAAGPLDTPRRLLVDAVAQGLVRFDATGQISPGLAERWIVIDDGMSYIFRLRDAEWGDGRRVTASEVVTILKRLTGSRSRSTLAPFLSAIDEVVEMTPEVIEIRLSRPRPDLLKLFAQPEMAVFRTRPPGGTGPFRIAGGAPVGTMLKPAFDPARAGSDDVEEPGPEQSVELIGERASRAILRFLDRQSDLVAGGSYLDWPLVAASDIAPANLKIDPAAGLFGLAVVAKDGFLSDPRNRIAVSQSIDRAALVAAFAPGWQPAQRLLPDQLDSAAAPAEPAWASLSPAARRDGARAQVARWQADHPGPVELRIALPSGPGATIVFGFVGAALKSIGIEPRRVAINAPADLRLVDAVAPYDSARWYLATACVACGDAARQAIEAARDAPDLASRAQRIAEADVALNEDSAFITIARPLRWSIVAVRLGRWEGNSRAWHPLNALRNDTR